MKHQLLSDSGSHLKPLKILLLPTSLFVRFNTMSSIAAFVLRLRDGGLLGKSKQSVVFEGSWLRRLPNGQSGSRRSMSMFLWRHLPIYRKDYESERVLWRLNKHQKKPTKPVRVEGIRPAKGKVDFRLAILNPDGSVRPFRGKHGQEFLDFWREWTERWTQMEDYQKARNIPLERWCPRCDEPLNWIGRAPSKWVYTPVLAKRSLFAKTANKSTGTALIRVNGNNEKENVEEDYEGPLEDRYCCTNDECGIREARFEYKRNTVEIEIIEGLSDKKWRPTRFRAGRDGRENSERAKARLAETPFVNKGWPRDLHLKDPTAPYLNSVSHEQAIKIVEQKATARYNNLLERPSFGKRPVWYTLGNNFRYGNGSASKKKFSGVTPCDECHSEDDKNPSACFSCGFILCKTCRDKAFPKHKHGYYPWGACPSCNKQTNRSLDTKNEFLNHKSLKRIIETKHEDPRRAQWLLALGNAYVESRRRIRAKQKAKDFFLEAGNLGLLQGYNRLADFYAKVDEPPDYEKAKYYYEKAGYKFGPPPAKIDTDKLVALLKRPE